MNHPFDGAGKSAKKADKDTPPLHVEASEPGGIDTYQMIGMNCRGSALLELRQQRAAHLQTELLKMALGVRLFADARVEQPAAGPQPAKAGAA